MFNKFCRSMMSALGIVCFLKVSIAQAVVGGEPVSSSLYAQALRSVIALKIRYSPCTGTYLGNGQILTAAHCLLLDGYPEEKSLICLQDIEGNSLGCFKENDYTVTFPVKEKDGPKAPVRGTMPGSAKVIRIPIPDMAIIAMNGFMPNIPPVTLSLDQAQNLSQGVETWIAGQGCNNYVTFEGREVMRLGKVQLDLSTDPLLYSLSWSPHSTSSGACPGDSGGPLFVLGPGDQMIQVGVISYIQRKFDSNGLTSVLNVFGRVDGVSASTWLKSRN